MESLCSYKQTCKIPLKQKALHENMYFLFFILFYVCMCLIILHYLENVQDFTCSIKLLWWRWCRNMTLRSNFVNSCPVLKTVSHLLCFYVVLCHLSWEKKCVTLSPSPLFWMESWETQLIQCSYFLYFIIWIKCQDCHVDLFALLLHILKSPNPYVVNAERILKNIKEGGSHVPCL